MSNPPSVERLPKRWLPAQDEDEVWERIRADPRWRAIWRTLLAPTDRPVACPGRDDEGEDDAMG